MSTNARIGIVRETDATGVPTLVESIYSHWDGYPEGVGRTLLHHWVKPHTVEQLIALGDLSALGTKLGQQHDFDAHTWDENDPCYGWCVAYQRDRGETDKGAIVHEMALWPNFGQAWEYLFVQDRAQNWHWLYRDPGYPYEDSQYYREAGPWEPLTEERVSDDERGVMT